MIVAVECQHDVLGFKSLFGIVVARPFYDHDISFEVKRVFLRKSGQPLTLPPIIPFGMVDDVVKLCKESGIELEVQSRFKIKGYRLIQYVPTKCFFFMKAYYNLMSSG